MVFRAHAPAVAYEQILFVFLKLFSTLCRLIIQWVGILSLASGKLAGSSASSGQQNGTGPRYAVTR